MRETGTYAVSVLLPNNSFVHHLVEKIGEGKFRVNNGSEVTAPFPDVMARLLELTTPGATYVIRPQEDDLADA